MNVYELDRPYLGCALIINNLHYEQKATRNDVTRLIAMFQKIKVQVHSVEINSDTSKLTSIAEELKEKDMKP